jgi:alkylation response protein AidB-like acyl-CoA dehydrogenase
MVLPSLEIADVFEIAVDAPGAAERETLAALAAFCEEVLPDARQRELEATATFPDAELRAFARRGFMHPFVPDAHGGRFDWSLGQRLALRVAAHDLDSALCLGGTVLATTPMLVAATEAQAGPFFRAILDGEMAAFALSEWAHGSDLASNEARAVLDADAFVLRGAKAPTNNGTRGAFVVALLRTSDDPSPFGHTLFLLARPLERLLPHERFASMGHRSMDLSGIILDGARVPREAIVGRLGEGFIHARRALEISRSGVSTMAAGVATAAVAHGLRHARQRVLYGAPIVELDAVRALLGRIAARALEAAAATRRTARAVARAAMSARSWTSLAKLLIPRLAEECVQDAGTILGSRSLMEDLPFARLRRAAPVLAIFDGSSQLQLDESWRAVGGWTSDPVDAWDHLRAPAPFDAHGEDDGTIARANPAAVLAMAAARLDDAGVRVLACGAMELVDIARVLRGAPQSVRFRVSDAAARLFGVASLAEAAIRGGDLAKAAMSVRGAELGPRLAEAIIATSHALGRSRPAVVHDLVALAANVSEGELRCFAALDQSVS